MSEQSSLSAPDGRTIGVGIHAFRSAVSKLLRRRSLSRFRPRDNLESSADMHQTTFQHGTHNRSNPAFQNSSIRPQQSMRRTAKERVHVEKRRCTAARLKSIPIMTPNAYMDCFEVHSAAGQECPESSQSRWSIARVSNSMVQCDSESFYSPAAIAINARKSLSSVQGLIPRGLQPLPSTVNVGSRASCEIPDPSRSTPLHLRREPSQSTIGSVYSQDDNDSQMETRSMRSSVTSVSSASEWPAVQAQVMHQKGLEPQELQQQQDSSMREIIKLLDADGTSSHCTTGINESSHSREQHEQRSVSTTDSVAAATTESEVNPQMIMALLQMQKEQQDSRCRVFAHLRQPCIPQRSAKRLSFNQTLDGATVPPVQSVYYAN